MRKINIREILKIKTKTIATRPSLKKIAIDHYNLMIDWAIYQSAHYQVERAEMISEINESWSAGNCAYCSFFLFICTACPLSSKKSCCGGLWKKMNDSKTWRKWVKNAKKVRNYIDLNG